MTRVLLPAPYFEIGDYLDRRNSTINSVAEIGHGQYPVVSTIPPGAAYTGYDVYDPYRKPREVERVVQQISQSNPNGDIDFRRLGRDELPHDDAKHYDEVVISNVLGDLNVAAARNLPERILTAAAQLVTHEGSVIVRETDTPYIAFMGYRGLLKRIFPKMMERTYHERRAKTLSAAGLMIRGEVSASSDNELWKQLEAIYNPYGVTYPSPREQQFYLFLGKMTRNR